VKVVDGIGIELEGEFPQVAAWVNRISDRPAVQRAYRVGDPIRNDQPLDDEARRHLFSQSQPAK
jgi:GST-like protein